MHNLDLVFMHVSFLCRELAANLRVKQNGSANLSLKHSPNATFNIEGYIG